MNDWMTPSTVLQVVTYVVTLVLAYAKLDKRITALEALRAEDAQRLERIEQKLDRLIEMRP